MEKLATRPDYVVPADGNRQDPVSRNRSMPGSRRVSAPKALRRACVGLAHVALSGGVWTIPGMGQNFIGCDRDQESRYGIIYGMRRTTVYLPDDLKAALERTAAAQGKSEAEVVRGALVAATADEAHPRPQVPLFDSGDSRLAERVDRELAAGFGE